MKNCTETKRDGNVFCDFHIGSLAKFPTFLEALDFERTGAANAPTNHRLHQETQVVVNDHIKVNIEQTAKGARVTVTYDRSDHDIQEAVNGAVQTYETTIEELNQRGMKVDDSKSS